MKLSPVEVEWIDSCSYSGWEDAAEKVAVAKPTTCRSVGYLIRRDASALVLVQSADLDDVHGDRYADALAIPAKMVVRVRRLK